ncbi:MAG: ParB/RepB/Spo0J family partition protein [Alphaproteobacteria bacterium]|jgi:ParB family chromosome partitioning protein|nr:ParB/RepB/Spo0J family partition protein [Alphaproteobacteria bacterium]
MTKDIDLKEIMVARGNFKKAPSLGKGISALLGDIGNKEVKEINIPSAFHIVKVDLNKCEPSRYQARKTFNQEELENLANSIKEKGVIQPVLLRKIDENRYEIIAGERRCRASKLAGLEQISAIIIEASDKEVMEIGLIENLHRKDLDVIEEAVAYKNLCDEFNYTHEDVAKVVGRSRSYVTNFLRILSLPQDILQLIKSGSISAGHAKMLVSAENPMEIAQKIIKDDLNVRKAEKLVKDNSVAFEREKEKLAKLSTEILAWQDKVVGEFPQIRVKINPKDTNSGEVKIKYSNIEELKKLLNF